MTVSREFVESLFAEAERALVDPSRQRLDWTTAPVHYLLGALEALEAANGLEIEALQHYRSRASDLVARMNQLVAHSAAQNPDPAVPASLTGVAQEHLESLAGRIQRARSGPAAVDRDRTRETIISALGALQAFLVVGIFSQDDYAMWTERLGRKSSSAAEPRQSATMSEPRPPGPSFTGWDLQRVTLPREAHADPQVQAVELFSDGMAVVVASRSASGLPVPPSIDVSDDEGTTYTRVGATGSSFGVRSVRWHLIFVPAPSRAVRILTVSVQERVVEIHI
jgi:hypothetical protein